MDPADPAAEQIPSKKNKIALDMWARGLDFVPSVGQITFMAKFKQCWSAYGSSLRNKDAQRAKPRPIAVKYSMHLVLRSSQATDEWSMKNKKNKPKVDALIEKFSEKYKVKILSMANVGNHIHFHLQFASRALYLKFIRALTGAIAMVVTGVNKFKKLKKHFWDYRPFTRIVFTKEAFAHMKDYISINQIEAGGFSRQDARRFVRTSPG